MPMGGKGTKPKGGTVTGGRRGSPGKSAARRRQTTGDSNTDRRYAFGAPPNLATMPTLPVGTGGRQGSPGQSARHRAGITAANANADQALGNYEDPFGGANALDALLTGLTNSGGSGGGSGRGGGGGGGGGGGSSAAADDDAAKQAAAEAIWRQIDALNRLEQTGLGGLTSAYAQQQAALEAAAAAQNSSFDAYGNQISGVRDTAKAGYATLLNELNAGAANTRQQSAGIFQRGDQALQGIGQQYQAMADNRASGANRTLSAFGAGEVAPQSGVQDYVTAARVNNSQMGTAADQLYGTRSNVYNGLNSDANTQTDQRFSGLMAGLAAQRQGASAQQAQQRAALALKQAQEEQAMKFQIAQQRAALEGQLY